MTHAVQYTRDNHKVINRIYRRTYLFSIQQSELDGVNSEGINKEGNNAPPAAAIPFRTSTASVNNDAVPQQTADRCKMVPRTAAELCSPTHLAMQAMRAASKLALGTRQFTSAASQPASQRPTVSERRSQLHAQLLLIALTSRVNVANFPPLLISASTRPPWPVGGER